MLAVARRNPRFARLWLAQIVSQGGDWLNRIALLTIIGRLSGGQAATAMGAMFAVELATRLLPSVLFGPLAGPVADRVPRRAVMITGDLLRAAVVLAYLWIREPADLPYLYALLFLHMSITVFFESAHSAAVPSTVATADLHHAYTLTAATWSAMLAVGALVGGVVVASLGVEAVFVLDAATYLVSGALLIGLELPPMPPQAQPFRLRDVVLLTELRRGYRHARDRGVAAILLTKTLWGGVGGYLVLLSIAANERFSEPAASGDTRVVVHAGLAAGLLFAARGLGTGLGPVIARRASGSDDRALIRQIGLSFVVAPLGYAAFALAHSLPAAMLCVVVAHMGGSVIWVASTTLWQRRIDDAFRGRVFACEFVGLTLTLTLGALLAGWLYDRSGSLSATTWTISAIVLACGFIWRVLARDTQNARA